MTQGKPAYLETYGSQFVLVERRGKSIQLVVKNIQINDRKNSNKVTLFVHEVQDGSRICMAFCFELKNKKKVFPVVTGDEIALEEGSKEGVTSLDKRFLFQWTEKTGLDFKTLNSVAEPSKYLSIKGGKVTIQETAGTFFKIHYLDINNNAKEDVFGRSGVMSTCMVRQNIRINDNGNPSKGGMYLQSGDMSARMVVENIKMNDDGISSKGGNHLEMLQDSTPTYLKTRNRKYTYFRSKDGSTRIVVENIKISDIGNPRTGKTRGFDKYIAVKRQLNTFHNINDTATYSHCWSNQDAKKI